MKRKKLFYLSMTIIAVFIIEYFIISIIIGAIRMENAKKHYDEKSKEMLLRYAFSKNFILREAAEEAICKINDENLRYMVAMRYLLEDNIKWFLYYFNCFIHHKDYRIVPHAVKKWKEFEKKESVRDINIRLSIEQEILRMHNIYLVDEGALSMDCPKPGLLKIRTEKRELYYEKEKEITKEEYFILANRKE